MDTTKSWSIAEERFLIENYALLGSSKVAIKLGRTVESVRGKAKRLKITRHAPKKWTEEEIAFLQKKYEKIGTKKTATFLDRCIGSVSQKAKELGLKFRKRPVISKEKLQKAVNKSYCITNLLENINKVQSGSSVRVVKKYLKDYKIDTSHFDPFKINRERMAKGEISKSRPIECYLKNGSKISSSNLKEKLYKEGLKERNCETSGCGQGEEWMGNKISLILDHINGDSKDNRLENLRIVCPNCNAALPTHCRGKKAFSNEKTRRQLKVEELQRQRGINGGFTDAEIERAKKQRRVKRPSLDILLKNIDELGYVGTGKKYGVSDNAIRKWIKNRFESNTQYK